MKSLKKFICPAAKLEMFMTNALEDDCLYVVRESPKRRNAKRKESNFKFWHSNEANEKFIELVTFWCR